MGKKRKREAYYAVRCGLQRGIFTRWVDCKPHVYKVKGARYKKFSTLEEAREYLGVLIGSGGVIKKKRKVEKKKEVANYFSELENVEIDREIKKEKDEVSVWTDGSYRNGVAGAGVYFGKGDSRNASLKVPGKQSNNRGELYAVIGALKKIDEKQSVRIFTDSKYVIALGRKQKKGVVNLDLVGEMLSLLENRKVTFEHVYGHMGNKGNEEADRLAKVMTTAKQKISSKEIFGRVQ